MPRRRPSDSDKDYILVELQPGERQRLAAIANLNERSLNAEIRWRLRHLLRTPRGEQQGIDPAELTDQPAA